MKKNIKFAIFIGIFIGFLIIFKQNVFADTQTRYYRSDTYVINGFSAYKLGIINTTAETYFTAPYGPGGAVFNSDVIRRQSNGTETVLGSSVAQTSRGVISAGEQSGAWSCPQTSLNSTDAIRIVERAYNTDPAYGGASTQDFITEQLGWTQLNATTWTFIRWTFLYYLGDWAYQPQFWYGSPSYNSRIEGISYTAPPPYIDCGFRIYDSATIKAIACEPAGTLTSPLRIRKGSTTYGIVLVATSDPNASKIRIQTSSGIKALRKF